jgi:hypothetical protein
VGGTCAFKEFILKQSKRLGPVYSLILLRLGSAANENAEVVMSIEEIADSVGFSRRTVSNALSPIAMVASGVDHMLVRLRVECGDKGEGSGVRRTGTRWKINLPLAKCNHCRLIDSTIETNDALLANGNQCPLRSSMEVANGNRCPLPPPQTATGALCENQQTATGAAYQAQVIGGIATNSQTATGALCESTRHSGSGSGSGSLLSSGSRADHRDPSTEGAGAGAHPPASVLVPVLPAPVGTSALSGAPVTALSAPESAAGGPEALVLTGAEQPQEPKLKAKEALQLLAAEAEPAGRFTLGRKGIVEGRTAAALNKQLKKFSDPGTWLRLGAWLASLTDYEGPRWYGTHCLTPGWCLSRGFEDAVMQADAWWDKNHTANDQAPPKSRSNGSGAGSGASEPSKPATGQPGPLVRISQNPGIDSHGNRIATPQERAVGVFYKGQTKHVVPLDESRPAFTAGTQKTKENQ